jgi:hypothetical protein
MASTELFLWVNGIIIAMLIALLVAIYKLIADLKPIISSVKTVDDWLREKGLSGLMGNVRRKKSHSLPPDRATRRDELVRQGREYGLTDPESNELQALLQEDARDDFANGIIGLMAFGLILAGVVAIVRSLSKKSST